MKNKYGYILTLAKKLKSISILGNCCSKCKNSDFRVLNFHHINNLDDKLNNINEIKDRRWSVIEREIKKCVLLCSNCHGEHHYENDRTKIKYSYRYVNKKLYLEYKKCDSCTICGYDKCIASLDLHHVDMLDKDFDINKITNGFHKIEDLNESIKLELDKCIVICKNCHSKKHFDSERFENYKKEIYRKIDTYKELPVKYDREEIIKLKMNGFKNIEIAKMLGCTESTITYALKGME